MAEGSDDLDPNRHAEHLFAFTHDNRVLGPTTHYGSGTRHEAEAHAARLRASHPTVDVEFRRVPAAEAEAKRADHRIHVSDLCVDLANREGRPHPGKPHSLERASVRDAYETTGAPSDDPLGERRIGTPSGTVCIMFNSGQTARVVSGRDVGWLRFGGRTLYATAFLRKEGETWTIAPTHSAVTDVVDDKADTHVDEATRDRALAFLLDTFTAWCAANPDVHARALLSDRQAEERRTEEEIERFARRIEALREELAVRRRATAMAREYVETVVDDMALAARAGYSLS